MTLSAEHVAYSYPGSRTEVLSDVSFSMENTECVTVMAPSGTGKTTFCQILAGYRRPSRGKVLLDKSPLPERGYCPVQMIWQHPELAVNPRLKMGKVLREGNRIEERIIKGLGIEADWCDRYPQELSGGEIARFGIARALGEGTRFLIADEITAMLDMVTQSQIWNFLLEELKSRQIGLLMVSHDAALVRCIRERFPRGGTDHGTEDWFIRQAAERE